MVSKDVDTLLTVEDAARPTRFQSTGRHPGRPIGRLQVPAVPTSH
jgi:hypothetical protein